MLLQWLTSFWSRDKLEMAWRHKSRSEKTLIKVIGFLVITLLCFIVAVIAMDFGFKARIETLEEEIRDLKSPEPTSVTTVTYTTEELDYNTTTESFVSTTSPEITTTTISTEMPSSSTTTEEATTSATTTDNPSSSPTPTDVLFEALRSMLRNFSGMKTSANSFERITHRGTFTSKARGTFIIMADIDQEESQSIIPEASSTSVPVLYIDSSETSIVPPGNYTNNSTSEVFEDMEDEFETAAPDEGSGEGTQAPPALPP
ncbi:uncharacterized protein LOC135226991 isoform X2 [Macrobrachium nipponense]|uniref:uncharacterized protein LOC135226991 isoform X2 n=1 Tax=Macrobrachium nipponense TaxID=159736 RepID=UPI0030C87337